MHRYLQTNKLVDLKDAISMTRTAVELTKNNHQAVLGAALGNLGTMLLERAARTTKNDDLAEALQYSTWALECLSDRDADRAVVLATVGSILARRYERIGEGHDLEEAISRVQTAARIQKSLEGDSFSALVFHNLGSLLEKRYECTGKRDDLQHAIDTMREATAISPEDPQMLAGIELSLTNLLIRKYECTGNLQDLANALPEVRTAVQAAPELPELEAILSRLGRLARVQYSMRMYPSQTTEAAQ
ncbi:hypothetical protein BO71DRAFT_340557, partial [Aspergillus ellipticus CBS 707.79]